MSFYKPPAPPPGYLVEDSPNEGENGTFACPHHGCDGMAFYTVEESHEHEQDWHSGPYICEGCDKKFTARPALQRHGKAGKHDEARKQGIVGLERKTSVPSTAVVCTQVGCFMEGITFSDQASFLSHSLGSPAHQQPGDYALFCAETVPMEGIEEFGDVQMGNTQPELPTDNINTSLEVEEELVIIDDKTEDGNSKKAPWEENGYLCMEPCCHRYKKYFNKYSEYHRHVVSQTHVCAQAAGLKLFLGDYTDEEFEKKRQALREWRCDKEGCPEFGRTLSSSDSFHSHFLSLGHQRPTHAAEDREAKRLEKKLKRETRYKKVCTVQGCRQFQHTFSTARGYRYHEQSAEHIRALSVPQFQDAAQQTSEGPEQAIPWVGFAPMTPTTGRGSALPDGPSTPAPQSAGWNEASLQRRNEELEERVRLLEQKVSGYKNKSPQKSGWWKGILGGSEE